MCKPICGPASRRSCSPKPRQLKARLQDHLAVFVYWRCAISAFQLVPRSPMYLSVHPLAARSRLRIIRTRNTIGHRSYLRARAQGRVLVRQLPSAAAAESCACWTGTCRGAWRVPRGASSGVYTPAVRMHADVNQSWPVDCVAEFYQSGALDPGSLAKVRGRSMKSTLPVEYPQIRLSDRSISRSAQLPKRQPHLRRDLPTSAPRFAHICAENLRRGFPTSARGLGHICSCTHAVRLSCCLGCALHVACCMLHVA